MRAVRKTGVAFDREEHTLGICAAGVALRDLLGNYVAISVPVPAQRFSEQQLSRSPRHGCWRPSAPCEARLEAT